MNGKLKVNSWVAVGEGCPIDYLVHGSDVVDFVFGGGPDNFEFGFDAEVLREFVKLADKALQEIDAQHVQDESDDTEPGGNELITTGGRKA